MINHREFGFFMVFPHPFPIEVEDFEVQAAQNSNSIVPLGRVVSKDARAPAKGRPVDLRGKLGQFPRCKMDWTWCSPSLRSEHLVVLMPGMGCWKQSKNIPNRNDDS